MIRGTILNIFDIDTFFLPLTVVELYNKDSILRSIYKAESIVRKAESLESLPKKYII